MLTLNEIEQEAMKLPDRSRAYLVSRLLASLPAVLSDDDDGVAEAMRRTAELERNPELAITLEEVIKTAKQ
jgi:Putative addiction module component